jgi:hypothetical protein
MPAHVDAIVMLNGPGDRLDSALDLAWAHRAPMIVIARGSRYWGHGNVCAPKIPPVKVICFDPDPSTTRGEAEFAGRLARQYRWHSIVLVAIATQDIVARLRTERCFRGRIYVLNAPFPAANWPYEIAHEWGSTVKALFVQRSCLGAHLPILVLAQVLVGTGAADDGRPSLPEDLQVKRE